MKKLLIFGAPVQKLLIFKVPMKNFLIFGAPMKKEKGREEENNQDLAEVSDRADRQLDRLVTMKPPREAGLGKGSLWVLEVALYGLDDASLQFYMKCKDIFHNLGLTQSKMDLALFYRLDKQSQLDGALETHVDDFLHGGSESFDR